MPNHFNPIALRPKLYTILAFLSAVGFILPIAVNLTGFNCYSCKPTLRQDLFMVNWNCKTFIFRGYLILAILAVKKKNHENISLPISYAELNQGTDKNREPDE